jgi:hypothetical protein
MAEMSPVPVDRTPCVEIGLPKHGYSSPAARGQGAGRVAGLPDRCCIGNSSCRLFHLGTAIATGSRQSCKARAPLWELGAPCGDRLLRLPPEAVGERLGRAGRFDPGLLEPGPEPELRAGDVQRRDDAAAEVAYRCGRSDEAGLELLVDRSPGPGRARSARPARGAIAARRGRASGSAPCRAAPAALPACGRAGAPARTTSNTPARGARPSRLPRWRGPATRTARSAPPSPGGRSGGRARRAFARAP